MAELNAEGAKGWELVSFRKEFFDGGHKYFFEGVMKRRK
jgi:hypothetical protein